MKKVPIYVDREIYDFFTTLKDDYGNYNNVVKAILKRMGNLYLENIMLSQKIDDNTEFDRRVLMESVKNRATATATVTNANVNALPTRPPQQSLPDKGFARDLQNVFNALANENKPIKPSEFLKKQNEVLKPPPPPALVPPKEPSNRHESE